ncbi:hypothetical protein CXB51_024472 [Gossypium anomalum]|uniref:Integrase catalytic domain-containing protein n=1 Tax=Gossypium anomalum TaxID=47600 RepID=A0A8J5Y5Y7_9ROSI|nr:hypothetical protein CXB51_024472 [Gossypium anomalum]
MRHLIVRHTPQQNGVEKRMNRTIMEKVRCMLSNANLPKSFWAEVESTACFLINRSPSVAIEKKTPQEVWSGNPADYFDLRIFGCLAYAHTDNGKLEPRSIKCVFLGYKAGVKWYKLWCPENGKLMISRDVVFDETAMLPNLSLKDSSNKENQKQKYAKADLVAYVFNMAEDIDANLEPSNYSEAKEGTPGVEEPRYKARLVAKGYSQIPGVDFTDVFPLIVKHSSIRVLLDIVAMHDLELEQLILQSAKPVSTPLAAHFRLSSALSPQSDDEIEYMSHVPYSSVVGFLMYAMVCSRPDLSYAVSAVSRNMVNPSKEYWKAVQWILSYLRGTTDVCLQFGRTRDGVIGYVDFVGDRDRRRSLTGYVFTIGGCAISWKATLQTTVVLSTTEAEYMAITEA